MMSEREQSAMDAHVGKYFLKFFQSVAKETWIACSEYHRQQAAEAESAVLREVAAMPMVVLEGPQPPCICHRCIRENKIMDSGALPFLLNTTRMIVCSTCGNKRCPKASDHRLACTGSNESGQAGSVYGRYEDPIELRNRDHEENAWTKQRKC